MKRGDLVTVSAQGDYGKPRPVIGHLSGADMLALNNMLSVMIGPAD